MKNREKIGLHIKDVTRNVTWNALWSATRDGILNGISDATWFSKASAARFVTEDALNKFLHERYDNEDE